MNPCFRLDLRKGCMVAGVWTSIYSMIFAGLFSWQLGMINSCEDSLAEFIQLFDFCHEMNEVTHCPCRHRMTISEYETLLSGLFTVQLVAVVSLILLLFSSACLLWALSESANRYFYWPWFGSCIMNILVMVCYCVMWWVGHAEGYWIALTVISLVAVILNAYCICCVFAYYCKVRNFEHEGGFYPDKIQKPSSEIRNFLTTEFDSSSKPITVLNYQVAGSPMRNLKSTEMNLKPPEYQEDSGYGSVRSSDAKRSISPRVSPDVSPYSKSSPSESLESRTGNNEPDKVDVNELAPELPVRRNTGSSLVKLAVSKRSINNAEDQQRLITASNIGGMSNSRIPQKAASSRSYGAKSSSSPTLDRAYDFDTVRSDRRIMNGEGDQYWDATWRNMDERNPDYDDIRQKRKENDPYYRNARFLTNPNAAPDEEIDTINDGISGITNDNGDYYADGGGSDDDEDDFDYISNDLDYDVPPARQPTSPVSPASSNDSNGGDTIPRRNTPRGRKNNRYVRRKDSPSHQRSSGRHHRSKSPRQRQIEQLHRRSNHFDEQSQVCNCDRGQAAHEMHGNDVTNSNLYDTFANKGRSLAEAPPIYDKLNNGGRSSDFVDAMTNITVQGELNPADYYDVPKSLRGIAV